MSINYYAVTPETPEGEEWLHIGKHIANHEFLFRAHRDLGLITVEAWREYLSQPGVRLVTDHGWEESLADFMANATLRPADDPHGRLQLRKAASFRDERGVPFADYELS
ncbi:hypothetical protein OG884_05950 [Streptosporangium sp. NBC_01755]|uniref:hypothetical protein n=1 Tax=Streptosporangium sp. NBC_01755 TaxID=2975949 RepID=UPI002DDA1B85|nr:hypothetical protein [Streptosporangium sp. NBC_01755]WSD01469.1 hypothetical protein OG884_05950 [Streptosporangium sp. NBC_01755]